MISRPMHGRSGRPHRSGAECESRGGTPPLRPKLPSWRAVLMAWHEAHMACSAAQSCPLGASGPAPSMWSTCCAGRWHMTQVGCARRYAARVRSHFVSYPRCRALGRCASWSWRWARRCVSHLPCPCGAGWVQPWTLHTDGARGIGHPRYAQVARPTGRTTSTSCPVVGRRSSTARVVSRRLRRLASRCAVPFVCDLTCAEHRRALA